MLVVAKSTADLQQHRGGQAHLSKMDLVKDDLIGMSDTPESCDEGRGRDQCKDDLVIAFRPRCGGNLSLGRLRDLVYLDVRDAAILILLPGAGNVSLSK